MSQARDNSDREGNNHFKIKDKEFNNSKDNLKDNRINQTRINSKDLDKIV